MVRLIDADALKEKIEQSGGEGTIAKYCKRVLAECLDNDAPTIDAIPVEWLNQKYAENEPGKDKDYDYFLWDAIAYILTEWQKEQEART